MTPMNSPRHSFVSQYARVLFIILVFVVLLLGFLFTARDVRAQEVEATDDAPVIVTTAIPDGGVTVIDDDPTNEIISDTPVVVIQQPANDDMTPFLLNFGAVVLLAVAGGGGALLILSRITESKQAVDNAEKLFEGLSPTWQATIREVVVVAREINRTAERLLDFADRATDRLPNQEEEPPPP